MKSRKETNCAHIQVITKKQRTIIRKIHLDRIQKKLKKNNEEKNSPGIDFLGLAVQEKNSYLFKKSLEDIIIGNKRTFDVKSKKRQQKINDRSLQRNQTKETSLGYAKGTKRNETKKTKTNET